MTTLADMTPEQRADCVGKWHEISTHQEPHLGILLYLGTCSYHGDEVGYLWVPSIADGDADPFTGEVSLNTLIPRLDLPRAWNPDGSPVEMDVEGADYRPGTNRGFYTLDETIQKGRELPEGTTRARRYVGEWEQE